MCRRCDGTRRARYMARTSAKERRIKTSGTETDDQARGIIAGRSTWGTVFASWTRRHVSSLFLIIASLRHRTSPGKQGRHRPEDASEMGRNMGFPSAASCRAGDTIGNSALYAPRDHILGVHTTFQLQGVPGSSSSPYRGTRACRLGRAS